MTDVELPPPSPEERELSRKLAELAELEEALAERELARATLQTELHVFQLHYLETVGRRYTELDAIEAEIAELELCREPGSAELVERAEAARARAQESEEALETGRSLPQRRAGPPPESLKKLFRKVARVIHPDLAEDDAARARRQDLMAAANLAFETGDELRLSVLLREWEESPEAVAGHGLAADLLRAIRRIAHAEERLTAVEQEIAALQEGELHRLRERVEAAERSGRDLLAEMAAALEPRILEVRERLEALLQQEAEP